MPGRPLHLPPCHPGPPRPSPAGPSPPLPLSAPSRPTGLRLAPVTTGQALLAPGAPAHNRLFVTAPASPLCGGASRSPCGEWTFVSPQWDRGQSFCPLNPAARDEKKTGPRSPRGGGRHKGPSVQASALGLQPAARKERNRTHAEARPTFPAGATPPGRSPGRPGGLGPRPSRPPLPLKVLARWASFLLRGREPARCSSDRSRLSPWAGRGWLSIYQTLTSWEALRMLSCELPESSRSGQEGDAVIFNLQRKKFRLRDVGSFAWGRAAHLG